MSVSVNYLLLFVVLSPSLDVACFVIVPLRRYFPYECTQQIDLELLAMLCKLNTISCIWWLFFISVWFGVSILYGNWCELFNFFISICLSANRTRRVVIVKTVGLFVCAGWIRSLRHYLSLRLKHIFQRTTSGGAFDPRLFLSPLHHYPTGQRDRERKPVAVRAPL